MLQEKCLRMCYCSPAAPCNDLSCPCTTLGLQWYTSSVIGDSIAHAQCPAPAPLPLHSAGKLGPTGFEEAYSTCTMAVRASVFIRGLLPALAMYGGMCLRGLARWHPRCTAAAAARSLLAFLQAWAF